MTLQLTMLYLLLLLEILMLDLQSGGLMTKPQLKAQNWNPLQLCMGFVNSYHNPPSIATIFFLFLIFTDQTNWIVDSGVHPSLHYNCHHQIMYCKPNLNIKYPPPHECLVWDYNKANVEILKNLLYLSIGN